MASRGFGFLSCAHLLRGFGLRAFQVRVRRWLASDFEKTPLDKVQPGRACDAQALVIPGPHRKLHSSVKNKGFCNFFLRRSLLRLRPALDDESLTLLSTKLRDSDAAGGDMTVMRQPTLRIAARIIFAVGCSLRSVNSVRMEMRGGDKPANRPLARRSARQMELIENRFGEQRLAMKVRSRLRVICATPFQKRPEFHRSQRFLCCVCRSLR